MRSVLLALDPSARVLERAMALGADLVITHHPLIFQPIRSLNISAHPSRLVAGFLRAGISLLAGHTNLDSVRGGVSDLLADMLDLGERFPIRPLPGLADCGLGRIGNLPAPSTLGRIAGMLFSFLSPPGLMFVGDLERPIRRVALCGGSGSDLWSEVRALGADLYISAELKHHVAREAEEAGICLIDAGHFSTEWPIVPALAGRIERISAEKGWGLEVRVFGEERPPFSFYGHVSGGTPSIPSDAGCSR